MKNTLVDGTKNKNMLICIIDYAPFMKQQSVHTTKCFQKEGSIITIMQSLYVYVYVYVKQNRKLCIKC